MDRFVLENARASDLRASAAFIHFLLGTNKIYEGCRPVVRDVNNHLFLSSLGEKKHLFDLQLQRPDFYGHILEHRLLQYILVVVGNLPLVSLSCITALFHTDSQ